ncbi:MULTISPECIES: amidase [unclassified Chelatococcus]|jgi:aspartyl-tRNA(Asn)/glutamyl-tRNA(Gln) amidotransferase subunit A|uniref:amidase n=1 Tax=unclassified Chelatococcus TaxID=2638111 RepID=UPI001BCEC133|nr:MULTISPECIES: amidase [unclassified Chelatococcus]CAH1657643.1 Asp-tRNAAsn/Glu-tRNAGln amidotransferase A subunit and related amidases [Hyphomicrobiales bacterium]MBS7742282.1 amidase [Chelatococcus sp. HY11]MBX3542600.1 amidase [Chelatococcus sp.]MCO5075183.1 amidase [Chelatococcus sp.]CAH1689249.1 Asp-tRNAAsn/Glu-tRNAGln amidotransferase A subunit and related amidases [Hyphomicrobiales bacterium]
MNTAPSLMQLSTDLAAGRTTSETLVEDCLARIADPAGEGARAFIAVAPDKARAVARAMDLLRGAGAAPSPFAGIPISVKDLFDMTGEVTTAGSRVLADAPPATRDAPAIARLRRAGFVVIGRTNMTEFAYSGLGLNPHYGTPRSVWRRAEERIPGGSSSGAAVSVADGMAHGAIGTDTGGSCRIPAAFNGLAGFKPTARRVPLEGALPLTAALDSIGSIARTVACCAALDSVMAGEPFAALDPVSLKGLRFLVPTTVALEDLDVEVATAFASALRRLSAAGARIEEAPFPEFDDVATINAKGGFTAADSYAWHASLLEKSEAGYDPRVAVRIRRGAGQTAADYIQLIASRRSLIERAARRLATVDAVLMPSVAMVPPRIADLADDEAFARANLLSLRNATLINMIDGCAISVPVRDGGTDAPVGLTIAGATGLDRRILAIAAAAEAVVSQALA